ncbi:MAG TPA: glycosyltransferase family 2 protein [Gemmataceae bacterium]|nr:glycosyltransferase family 2 protein [Gemmataceae bacterium]
MPLQICALAFVACVIYPYVGYPIILLLWAKCRGQPVARKTGFTPSVSLVVAAYNEQASIARCLEELTDLIAVSGLQGEVILVSDGSTDGTAAIARAHAPNRVKLIELFANVGKAAALDQGCAAARHEIIVFADVRQRWAKDALALLLENFADPAVGAASGDLVIEAPAAEITHSVGLYWRYEKWLRRLESRVDSTVGVTGATCAVRRHLFGPIPPGTVLDDVYWPLLVAMQGFRVVHDERAHAYDHFAQGAYSEFRRKVRTLSGNFQLAARLPAALLPWRNRIWFQFVSHKICRLLVPWALAGALITTALLTEPVYRVAFWIQVSAYLLGLAGLHRSVRQRLRLASVAASFLMLNAAAWFAFWIWVSGKTSKSWNKVRYTRPVGQRQPTI